MGLIYEIEEWRSVKKIWIFFFFSINSGAKIVTNKRQK